jgi:hypothetical protein
MEITSRGLPTDYGFSTNQIKQKRTSISSCSESSQQVAAQAGRVGIIPEGKGKEKEIVIINMPRMQGGVLGVPPSHFAAAAAKRVKRDCPPSGKEWIDISLQRLQAGEKFGAGDLAIASNKILAILSGVGRSEAKISTAIELFKLIGNSLSEEALQSIEKKLIGLISLENYRQILYFADRCSNSHEHLLSGCLQQTAKLPNLINLDLSGLESLKEIPPLPEGLKSLNVDGCVALWALPSAFPKGCGQLRYHSSLAGELHDAVKKGQYSRIEQLLRGGVSPRTDPQTGRSALMVAVQQGQVDVFKLLLSQGADIRTVDHKGQTVIDYAIKRYGAGKESEGRQIIAALLRQRALLSKDLASLFQAAVIQQDNGLIMELIDFKGALQNKDDLLFAISRACRSEDYELTAQIMERSLSQKLSKALVAIYFFAQKVSYELLKSLVGNVDNFNAADSSGMTLLMYAVERKDKEIASKLISGGAHVDLTNPQGKTALMQAVEAGHFEIAQLLLESGASPLIRSRKGDSLLKTAILADNSPMVEMLFQFGASLQAEKVAGRVYLNAAISSGNLKMVALLLEQGALLGTDPSGHKTPLQCAVEMNLPEVVRILIEAGADPLEVKSLPADVNKEVRHLLKGKSIVSKLKGRVAQFIGGEKINPAALLDSGETALTVAVAEGNYSLVEKLASDYRALEARNSMGETALFVAIGKKDSYMVELLLKNGANSDVRDLSGQTPLMKAIGLAHLEGVAGILNSAVSINIEAVDSEGETALWQAVMGGDTQMVELLLKGGAHANCRNSKGQPLLHALYGSPLANDAKIALMGELIRAGVNINAKGSTGSNLLTLATDNGDEMTVQLLLDNGADFTAKGCDGLPLWVRAKLIGQEGLAAVLDKKQIVGQRAVNKRILHMLEVAHSCKIQGMHLLQQYTAGAEPQIIDVEGAPGGEYWINQMIAVSRQLTDSQNGMAVPLLTSQQHQEMVSFLGSALLSRGDKLKRIQEGKSVLLRTGCEGHAATAVVCGNRFFLCDRGAGSKKPVEAFEFQLERLSDRHLEVIENVCNLPRQKYEKLFGADLPRVLRFNKGKFEEAFQQICPLKMQKAGNCSWESIEGAVWIFLAIEGIAQGTNGSGIFGSATLEANEQLVKPQTELFTRWLAAYQLQAMKQYLANHRFTGRAPQLATEALDEIQNQIMAIADSRLRRNAMSELADMAFKSKMGIADVYNLDLISGSKLI